MFLIAPFKTEHRYVRLGHIDGFIACGFDSCRSELAFSRTWFRYWNLRATAVIAPAGANLIVRPGSHLHVEIMKLPIAPLLCMDLLSLLLSQNHPFRNQYSLSKMNFGQLSCHSTEPIIGC